MCIDPLDPWARRRSDIHIASTHSSANTYMRHAFKKNRYGYENNDFRNLFKRYRKDIYKMDQWHTYTLVWDSAEVVFKMDNFEVGAIPKWYVRQLVGRRYPKCSEKNKEFYNFNNGYPWDKVSLSQLRISSGVAKEASLPAGEANLPNGHLGDVLIDYVKIWQKDSVSTGYSVWGKWKDPCMADPALRINGQDWLCYGSSAQYKISVHQPGGYWEIPAGFSTGDPLTGGTITLTRTNGLMYTNAVLKYHYKKSSSCDVKTVYFNLYCYRDGIEPATPFMVPISDNAGNRSLFFFDHTDYIGIARTPDERKKYNWEFKFIYPDTTINISRQGRFVDIPSDQVVRYNSDLVEMPYDLNISIGIDFPFEQEFVNVSKYITNANYQTNIIPIPEDTSMQLFHAYIDDIDSFNAQWDTLVDNFLFFEYELEDSVYLQEIRNQLKADLLAPYILEMQDSAVEGTISAGLKGIASSLELYPNPATQILNVKAELLKPEGQSIAIYDLYGKLVLRQEIKNDHIQIDVASFASGLYIVALSDNGRIIERKKFVKH